MGISPNNLVALVGPHSPLAQSGNGTITVCSSSQAILNLQTLLNFIGSPVKYSFGVTALANMSRRKAPEQGAWTRNATIFPTTDCRKFQFFPDLFKGEKYAACHLLINWREYNTLSYHIAKHATVLFSTKPIRNFSNNIETYMWLYNSLLFNYRKF